MITRGEKCQQLAIAVDKAGIKIPEMCEWNEDIKAARRLWKLSYKTQSVVDKLAL